MISLSPPDKRPNGDPLKDGDMWFNNCTGETWIRYDETWITLVNGGPKGPAGPKGDKGEDSTVQGPEGPQGEQGETGTFKTICSLSASETREDGSELRCGDMWFNTCSGELYVYYSGNWLGISDATGPQGPQGEQGPQGPAGLKGDPPGLQEPPAITNTLDPGDDAEVDIAQDEEGDLQFTFNIPRGDTGEQGTPGNVGQIGDNPPDEPDIGDLWFDTKCPSGLYIWDGQKWVGTATPGPNGPQGPQGTPGTNGTNGTDGTDGAPGADGADGEGVPTGGTAGQVLAKIDGTDFNTTWVDQTGGPGGGIPEAPLDGEQYARQNGGWSVVAAPAAELIFNAPLQRTGDDVSFAWNSINALP